MSKITLKDLKKALADPVFRSSLPPILLGDIQKYEQNPECACNIPVYRNVLRYGVEQLKHYFPGQNIPNPETELEKLAENHWSVISCHINELEGKLKSLPHGRKQLAVARWEDQVTVIVNELDLAF